MLTQEQKLLHAAQEWRVTFDGMRDPVCLIDRKGHIRRCNRAMQRLLGLPYDALLGRSCWQLIYGRARPPAGCGIRDTRQKPRLQGKAMPVRGRWYEVTTDPIFDEQERLVGGVHTLSDITERKLAEERLKQYGEQLRALSARMADVEEAERRRLARDLHDRVGQHLTALGINLNYVRGCLPDQPTRVRDRLDAAIREIEGISRSIRNVMRDLRPDVLDDYGLTPALHGYAQQFTEQTGIEAEVVEARAWPRFAIDVETAIFRVVQEALTNVAKHAQATRVTITFDMRANTAVLAVADNGIGFDMLMPRPRSKRSGWGLMTMSERAEGIGATWSIESAPGAGTRITVRMPMRPGKKRRRTAPVTA